jgi:hypothetical protein
MTGVYHCHTTILGLLRVLSSSSAAFLFISKGTYDGSLPLSYPVSRPIISSYSSLSISSAEFLFIWRLMTYHYHRRHHHHQQQQHFFFYLRRLMTGKYHCDLAVLGISYHHHHYYQHLFFYIRRFMKGVYLCHTGLTPIISP